MCASFAPHAASLAAHQMETDNSLSRKRKLAVQAVLDRNAEAIHALYGESSHNAVASTNVIDSSRVSKLPQKRVLTMSPFLGSFTEKQDQFGT